MKVEGLGPGSRCAAGRSRGRSLTRRRPVPGARLPIAVRPLANGVEHAVDEAHGVGPAEGAREFERLVDDHGRWHLRTLQQFVHREPEHEAVDDREPLEPPVGGRLGNHRVDAIERARGALGELHGQRVAIGHRRPQLQVAHAGDGLGERIAAQLPAIEHLQRALAGLAQVLRIARHSSRPDPPPGGMAGPAVQPGPAASRGRAAPS